MHTCDCSAINNTLHNISTANSELDIGPNTDSELSDMTTMMIHSSSETYHIVMAYMAQHDTITNYTVGGFKKNKKTGTTEVELKLPLGESYVVYQDHFIYANLAAIGKPVGTSFQVEQSYELTLASQQGKQHLMDFIMAAKKAFEYKKTDEILCKIMKNGCWSYLSRLPKRNIDTIILDDDLKQSVIQDVQDFLSNEDLYNQYGIPYKRNYLFTGSPGTGKTSFIFSLASHFNLNVGILNMGHQVDDYVFMKAINDMDDNMILILEDIDALFVERKVNDSNKSMVSFSGILNVMDGIARKHRLITFMTTNYPDRLDEALVRPGRIDHWVKFTMATKDQTRKMYQRFIIKNNRSNENTQIFEEFYQHIKGLKLSTAALQQFFFTYRNESIIKHVDKLKELVETPPSYNRMYS